MMARENAMIRLEFCGRLRPIAPSSLSVIAKPPEVDTLQQLRDWVGRQSDGLGEALEDPRVKLILNSEVTNDLELTVRDGDEVGFVPVMSGG
jgi:molybdopterin converting factor small subunit